MLDDVKQFIERNIEAIEENDFEWLYNEAIMDDIYASDLTEVLYTAGIDPLEHMHYVPERFAAGLTEPAEYVIPEGIKEFKSFAFKDNDLHKINLSSTICSLGKAAFAFCKNLTQIDTKNVDIIGEDCFIGCRNLNTLITSANIIKKFAFKDTNLENIFISKNINTIGFGAFNHVPATEIHYGGTKLEWSYVVLYDSWKDESLRKIICTDGEVLL